VKDSEVRAAREPLRHFQAINRPGNFAIFRLESADGSDVRGLYSSEDFKQRSALC
jgi:hypothetical protein